MRFFTEAKPKSLSKKSFSSKNIICALDETSKPFFYLKDQNIIIFNGKKLERIKEKFLIWRKYKDRFIGLSQTGFFYEFKNAKINKLIEKRFANVDGYSNFVTNDSSILLSTSFGIKEIKLNSQSNYEVRSLPITPCGEKQICGLSLAGDNSILVSGVWGTWFGRDKKFRRLKVASLSQKNGGVGISHISEGNKYIIVANDDADIGRLPHLETNILTHNSKSNQLKDSVFWLKRKVTQAKFLFQISIGEKQIFVHLAENESFFDERDVIYFEKSERLKHYLTPTIIDHSQIMKPTPWWHDYIGLRLAKKIAKNYPSKQIKIGIVDSGFEMNHEEFTHLTDSTYLGYDFVEEDELPNDKQGHGTHITAIIGGRTLGIAPYANLVIAKALDSKGQSNSIDLARAIIWSIDQGVDILNFSWGGGFKTQILQDAIEYGKAKKVLMLSSAGNNSLNIDKYPDVPVSFGGVVAIASSTQSSKLARHSNYGPKKVVFASPGEKIYSAYTDSSFKIMTGTSMAVAVASGTIGFLYAIDLPERERSPKKILEELCVGPTNYWKKYSRCGELILSQAITKILDYTPAN